MGSLSFVRRDLCGGESEGGFLSVASFESRGGLVDLRAATACGGRQSVGRAWAEGVRAATACGGRQSVGRAWAEGIYTGREGAEAAFL